MTTCVVDTNDRLPLGLMPEFGSRPSRGGVVVVVVVVVRSQVTPETWQVTPDHPGVRVTASG